MELDPKRPWARVFLGLALDQKGKYQEAIEQLQEAKLELGLPEFVDLAHVYAAARRRDEALAMVRRIELQDLKNNDPSDWCFIAGVYAAMGDKRRAFEYLDRAYRERDFALSFLKVDPWMDPLRSDRRFASMLRRIGLQ